MHYTVRARPRDDGKWTYEAVRTVTEARHRRAGVAFAVAAAGAAMFLFGGLLAGTEPDPGQDTGNNEVVIGVFIIGGLVVATVATVMAVVEFVRAALAARRERGA
jgi:hypothetical protein